MNKLIEKITKLFGILLCLMMTLNSFSQNVKNEADLLKKENTAVKNDSTKNETTGGSKSEPVKQPIDYASSDSLMFSLTDQRVFLYGNSVIKSEKIELKAAYIEIDMTKNILTAEGSKDTTGKEIGKPHFTEGSEKFDAKVIKYNYKTKKGLVNEVITEQSGGFLHGSTIKMFPDKQIHVLDGKFTTCDHDPPHFYIEMTKAIVYPGDKIVSGPLYFVIADIPMPLGLPFGFFPNHKGNASGVLIPSYGEEVARGFYLRDGGYYFAINDNIDLAITGEIYTKGGWGTHLRSNYSVKYKFSGNLDIKYNRNVSGEKDIPSTYNSGKDFWVNASFAQDPKANPTAHYNMSLNFGTSSYRKFNSTNINDYVNNTTSSSISYTKTWPGTPFNFSANAGGTQNTQTHDVSLNLPDMSFSMSRINPFKRKEASGETKWYEKIGITYSSNLKNSLAAKDSVLFKNHTIEKNSRYGFQHNIPIGTSFKMLKYFDVSPSVNFNGRIYPNIIEKRLQKTERGRDSLVVDTISKLNHNYDFGFSMPLSTTLYGMVQFKKFPVMAIRHVFKPSISFGYRPDFAAAKWGNYRPDPSDTIYNKALYSIYSNGIYGAPPQGKSGSISISVGNSLEMKVRDRRDTVNGFSKVTLLESFNFGTNYNMAADSLKWSQVSFGGSTKILKAINVSFSGAFDPYSHDTDGRQIDQLLYTKGNGQFLRFTNGSLSASGTLDPNTFKKKETSKTVSKDDDLSKDAMASADEYEPFNLAWSLQVNYTLNYSKTKFNKQSQTYEKDMTQTLNFGGGFTLGKNWRFSFGSGYDFKSKQATASNVAISRDLHCWEMTFTAIPFGALQSYNFRINVKSAMFKDIQYKRDKSWHDN